MSEQPPNPFDLLGIDPRLDPKTLTELLRQRAERALPEERKRLQGLWRALTLKDSDRARWALLAHPRHSQTDLIEMLRQRVPPFVSRHKPEALELKVSDLLTLPRQEASWALPAPPPAWTAGDEPDEG